MLFPMGGYVTEKIFDSMASGCIPIYSGDEMLEEGIINKDYVFYFDENKDSESLIKEVSKLHKNDKLLNSFNKQVRLFDYTVDYLWQRRERILQMLENLIEEKIKN